MLTLLWLLVRVLAAVPCWLQNLLVRLGVRYWLWFAKRDQEILFANLEHIWDLPRQSTFARSFARQVIASQMHAFFDSLIGIVHPEKITVEGLNHLQQVVRQAEAAGKGQILITGHMGSWELVGSYCAKAAEGPFYALAKSPRSPRAKALLEKVRGWGNCHILWTDNRLQLARSMLEILRNKAWLAFVMDQKPNGRRGPLVQFFGQETPFVAGPATAALQRGCPIIGVFCLRTGMRTYRLLSTPLVGPDCQESLDDLTQLLAAHIENVIRLYPEQWCWNYKRWVF